MKHYLTKQILKIINEFANETEMTMSDVAREANISKAWVSKLTNDVEANMSVETASNLLEVAGYELIVKKLSTNEKFSRLKKNNNIED